MKSKMNRIILAIVIGLCTVTSGLIGEENKTIEKTGVGFKDPAFKTSKNEAMQGKFDKIIIGNATNDIHSLKIGLDIKKEGSEQNITISTNKQASPESGHTETEEFNVNPQKLSDLATITLSAEDYENSLPTPIRWDVAESSIIGIITGQAELTLVNSTTKENRKLSIHLMKLFNREGSDILYIGIKKI